MNNRKSLARFNWPSRFVALAIAVFCLGPVSKAQAADPRSIPVVDGGIGSCSIEFTVTDNAAAPVYDAKIRVHIAYGFMRAHKLDLEVGTNADGKGRFTGLPDKVKEPLEFTVAQADRHGEATYNPAENCTAKKTVVVSKDGSGVQHQ